MKYALMARYAAEFDVRLMGRALGVSPSGYYATQRRATQPSPHAQRDRRLLLDIHVAHAASHERYPQVPTSNSQLPS